MTHLSKSASSNSSVKRDEKGLSFSLFTAAKFCLEIANTSHKCSLNESLQSYFAYLWCYFKLGKNVSCSHFLCMNQAQRMIHFCFTIAVSSPAGGNLAPALCSVAGEATWIAHNIERIVVALSAHNISVIICVVLCGLCRLFTDSQHIGILFYFPFDTKHDRPSKSPVSSNTHWRKPPHQHKYWTALLVQVPRV